MPKKKNTDEKKSSAGSDSAAKREHDLERARKIWKVLSHEATPENERESASRRLDELKSKWNFTDDEINPPQETLEPDDPIPPGLTFDEVLTYVGITRQQFSGFVGELAAKVMNALIQKLTRGK